LVYDLSDGQWNIPRLRKLLEQILPQDTTIDDFEVRHDFPNVGPKRMVLNARRIDVNSSPSLILLAMEDATP